MDHAIQKVPFYCFCGGGGGGVESKGRSQDFLTISENLITHYEITLYKRSTIF